MEWLPEIVLAVVIVALLIIPHVVLRDRKRKTTKIGEEKEICIRASCGAETAYSRDTPIDRRHHYVEGAGQLCDKCGEEFSPDEYRKEKDGFLKAL